MIYRTYSTYEEAVEAVNPPLCDECMDYHHKGWLCTPVFTDSVASQILSETQLQDLEVGE